MCDFNAGKDVQFIHVNTVCAKANVIVLHACNTAKKSICWGRSTPHASLMELFSKNQQISRMCVITAIAPHLKGVPVYVPCLVSYYACRRPLFICTHKSIANGLRSNKSFG